METLYAVSEKLEAVIVKTGRIFAWCAVPLMLIIIYDVVSRKLGFGGTVSSKLQELEWHFHAALFLMTFAYAYMKDAHVRIELLRDNFSGKTRALIEIIGILLVVFPFCGILVYFGADFWWRSWSIDESSATPTGLGNRWIIKFALPTAFVLIFFAGISVLLKCVVFLAGPDRLSAKAGRFLGQLPHEGDLSDAHAIEDK